MRVNSEDTPAYTTTMTDPNLVDREPYCKPWLCENCGEKLGMVVDGVMELWCVHILLKPDCMVTFCKSCGEANTWMFDKDNKEGGE